MEKIVIAFGGNALQRPGKALTYRAQARNVADAVEGISAVFRRHVGILVTHGNGTQVGEEFLRNEYAEKRMEMLPFPELVAETQAAIGTILETAILRTLRRMRVHRGVSTLLTHVFVSRNDMAFKKPTKPIGPVYSDRGLRAALKLGRFRYVGYGNGYRRVVASPVPEGVAESQTIRHLVETGRVVIAGGGGGIPIIDSSGAYPKAAAVIDKDFTAQLLGTLIGAQTLLVLTAEDYVYVGYPKKDKPIKSIHAKELKKLVNSFEDGTMRPKVMACINFIEHGGRRAYIGNLKKFDSIMKGRTGTRIIR